METYIEKRFKEISINTQNELLYNQWKIDKLLVVKILERIKDFFPHYTNHDSTHSEIILNNIYLLLGEDGINKFSSTDLWLLLQVAYFHDIGMVIDSEEIENTLKNHLFIDYIEKIKKDESHNLHEYVNIFEIKNEKLSFINTDLSIKCLYYPKYLLADFYRSKHGERIRKNVKTTFEKEFINRDGALIPKRLYEVIYKISVIHTGDFSEIYSLIIKENGFSIDKCHPRLIACLLRLGDLLDLDSNRYDNFMNKLSYDIPFDSIDHITKHRSIDSFNIDNESITIISKVKSEFNYNVYNYTKNWFNWIEEEVRNQNLNWHKIAPNDLKVTIPLVDRIEVIQEGFSLLPTGDIPHFSFSPEKALELIKGSQIYSDKNSYLREIIQNAIDSSYIKIWCESQKYNRNKFLDDKLPDIKEFENFEITIEVLLDEEKTTNENDEYNYYKIIIKDKGIGLSIDELKYLLNVGSSKENRQKEKIIEKMPNYLKPSGNFGIGFQSIFNITDTVNIKTKSYFTNEEIELTLQSPSRVNNVFFKKELDNSNEDSYFHLSFIYKVKKIATKYTLDLDRETEKYKYELMKDYDCIFNKEFDIDIFDIYKSLEKVCEEVLFIPIKLEFKDKKIEKKSDLSKLILLPNKKSIIQFTNELYSDIYFKGQKIKNSLNPQLDFGYKINFVGYKASDYLNYARDSFLNIEKLNEVSKETLESLAQLLIMNTKILDELDGLSKFLLYAEMSVYNEKFKEMFMNFNFNDINDDSYGMRFKNKISNWKESLIEFSNFNDLLNKNLEEEVIIERNSFSIGENHYEFFIDKDIFYSTAEKIRDIFMEKKLENRKYIYPLIELSSYIFPLELKISNKKDDKCEEKFYKDSLEHVRKNSRPPFNRYLWYVKEGYEDLAIDKECVKGIWIYKPSYFEKNIDFLIMPIFLKDYSGGIENKMRDYQIDTISDKFVDFVKSKLINKEISSKEIRSLYENLIETLK